MKKIIYLLVLCTITSLTMNAQLSVNSTGDISMGNDVSISNVLEEIYITNTEIKGKTITIGGGTNNIPSGLNIDLIAKEEIVINNGFNIPQGTTLDIIIDPNLCP